MNGVVQAMPHQPEQDQSAQDSQSAHAEPAFSQDGETDSVSVDSQIPLESLATDSEAPPPLRQASPAPTDWRLVPAPPLPTPGGSPVTLGPNPQEAPAIVPPWRRQQVEEDSPPTKRRKPNGVLELWHPYKAAVFFDPCYVNLGNIRLLDCVVCVASSQK